MRMIVGALLQMFARHGAGFREREARHSEVVAYLAAEVVVVAQRIPCQEEVGDDV